MRKKIHISDESVRLTDLLDQLGITDDISLMAEEMREDIYLELNQRIQYSIRRVFYLKIVAVAAS
ncbi:MAG: hypothetical protein LIP05_13040, partial [Tannerellaceae bacterium]|nr:hypothetical protein [Tannerellaceae bacterium]